MRVSVLEVPFGRASVFGSLLFSQEAISVFELVPQQP